ncbi:MAG: hypothetical protein JXQ29_16625, partial [Planctomycetes bacterium]|nr:hypothetical protein [Planctomycetota bacterium]
MAVFTRRRSKPGAGLTAALASVFLLAMTGTAQANVVLPPMYFLFLFSHPLGLLVLFLVVLALEAVSARHVLKEPWKVCVGVSLHANLCSTCFGFPLAFLAETV